jgi:hypothetical protein
VLENSVLGKMYGPQREAVRESREIPNSLAFAKYYSNDQIKDYETGGASVSYGLVETFEQGF